VTVSPSLSGCLEEDGWEVLQQLGKPIVELAQAPPCRILPQSPTLPGTCDEHPTLHHRCAPFLRYTPPPSTHHLLQRLLPPVRGKCISFRHVTDYHSFSRIQSSNHGTPLILHFINRGMPAFLISSIAETRTNHAAHLPEGKARPYPRTPATPAL